VVQHRTEHAVVRHAFSQVLHARYSRSPVRLPKHAAKNPASSRRGRLWATVCAVQQIVEAAADRCELLWLVDQTRGDIADMFPLLPRSARSSQEGLALAPDLGSLSNQNFSPSRLDQRPYSSKSAAIPSTRNTNSG
jgi:hypothetical protein